jgi:hypothetical protein
MKAGIIGLILIVGIGYAIRGIYQHTMDSVTTGSSLDCLAVLGSTTTEDEGRTYIVGSIQNNCDRNFSNVTVLFKVDSTPGAFGSMPASAAYAYGHNVKAGEAQPFKTAMPISRDATFRFDGINAF